MTDYKNLKLRASSNPHLRNGEDTRGLMLDVIIALMPALLFGVWQFGVRVAISAVVSVASAIFFEWLYRKLLHKPQMIGDLSAAVTGLLLSMVCPPELPVWMLVVGNFFAIFVVKQLYGGLGKNFLNPALAARAALVACYASAMTSWSKVDAATGATPMALLKAGDMEALTAAYPIKDMAIGFISGSAGEVSALMLLIGGVYLIVRKVISWQTPVAYIATVAVVTFLFPRGNDPMTFMLYNVLGVVLLNVQNDYTFIASVVYGITGGLGFLLAIYLFSTIRERVQFADYPKCFEGFPIALITAGLIALAFMGFSGLQVWPV